ncbi:MAG TPA: PaaI family thioesterase [Geodermatophilus sp.]|nr:PaaI family thioesterase [Geodermatophilus sp.]
MADDATPGGFAGRLGVRVQDTGDGVATIVFEVGDEHLNPAGTLHGGVVATLVDTVMGQAVRTTTGEGEVPATSQLTVTYLRPGKPGPLEVRGRVRTRGEHLTICEADVEQEGRSIAHAVATFALLDR